MILFFYGDDTFRSRQHLQKTIATFKEKRDPQGYNTRIFDGRDAALMDMSTALMARAFLAEKKMVVIEHCIASKNEALHEYLFALVSNKKISDDTVLVIWDNTGKLKGALFDVLQKEHYVQEFVPLSRAQCIAWIIATAKEKGIIASPMVAGRMYEAYGADLHALYGSINQLASYTRHQGRRDIALDDLSLFFPELFDDAPFHFVDALALQKEKQAFTLLHELWKSGSAPLEILGALLWQWRTLVAVFLLVDEQPNIRAGELAKQLKIHPFVAEKTMRMARATSNTILLAQYKKLSEIEYVIKRGAHAEALLELHTISEVGAQT